MTELDLHLPSPEQSRQAAHALQALADQLTEEAQVLGFGYK